MSQHKLWNDLRMGLSLLPYGAICVADALDEMDAGNEDFFEELCRLGTLNTETVKILITSRPVIEVEVPLRRAEILQIRLEEDMVDRDIAEYVKNGLQHSAISHSDQILIRKAVPGNANGLFLYAKLAMTAILELNIDIAEPLSKLPLDLNAMYTKLLRDHSQCSGVPDQLQLLILQWVTHATRPLRLIELADMINATEWKNHTTNLKAAKDLIRAACGPLLEILPNETISIIHHSLTEFLKDQTRLGDQTDMGYPVLDYLTTHESLAHACLDYLLSGRMKGLDVENIGPMNQYGQMIATKTALIGIKSLPASMELANPFLEYAIYHWHTHCNRGSSDSKDMTALLDKIDNFLQYSQFKRAWLEYCWPGGILAKRKQSPLHIAANQGLKQYAAKLLESNSFKVDRLNGMGQSPLYIAARSGNVSVVKLLLDAGCDPDLPSQSHGLKPIHEAAQNNHSTVVEILIKAGVDPLTEKTREDPKRQSWDPELSTTIGNNALFYACYYGHHKVAEILLSYIQEDKWHHLALKWSASYCHPEVTETVLRHAKVDLNRTISGATPLTWAYMKQNFQIAMKLLKAGADPNIGCKEHPPWFQIHVRDEIDDLHTKHNETTALHQLARNRGFAHGADKRMDVEFYDFFELMMQQGLDANRTDSPGKSLLHHWSINPVMTRLLLNAGANANVTTKNN